MRKTVKRMSGVALMLVLMLQAGAAFGQGQVARRAADNPPSGANDVADPSEEAAIQVHINAVYEQFHNSYRLGPGDVIAIYVDKHPQDTVERIVVSPVGQVYHPLLGNVPVAGKTLSQLQNYFTAAAIGEFIKNPRVTVALLEAQSNKIGVLGDVHEPGVKLITRPTRVLDAITMAGGITETGNASKVSVLRQFADGRTQVVTVNVKKILQGKADPEENIYLRAGDTIIVPGNLFKSIQKITSLVGVTGFVTFLTGIR